MPLSIKVTGIVFELYRWSGSRYKELYKHAGVQSVVESFRAILLADLFSKNIQGTIRAKTVDFSGDYFSDYQFAGRSNRGGDLASRIVKSLLDVRLAVKCSILLIFIDL